MRTALWVGLTVAFIVAVGVAYVMMQPKGTLTNSAVDIAKRESPTTIPLIPATEQAGSGPGEGVWVKVPDAKTGALAWQFRASHYDPQPDNTVLCQNPEAQFFYNNGQIVTITGTHGRVIMSGNGLAGGVNMRGPSSPPSRGELYDVVVTMSTLANPRHAILRCRTNNAVFDNDTFRIATDAFKDKNGVTVPADQVPVQVRGDDYDFDGRGLIIRWNDLDRHLQYLEVTHGQELVVKNSNLLPAQPGASTKPASRPAGATSRPATRPTGRSTAPPARSGSKKKASAAVASATTETTTEPTTKKAATQPVYHAVFNDGVKVTQADKTVAIADTMAVDFKEKDQDTDDEESSPTSGAASERRTAPATRRANAPVTRPATPKPPAAAPPTQPPLIIRWPGKLVVTPIDVDPPNLEPGEMNMHLESANRATKLNYTGWDVVCAACTYLAGGKGAELTSSQAVPLVSVKDQTGATLYTPHLEYRHPAGQTTGIAIMTGKSRAIVPIQATTQPTGAATPRATDMLKADWSDSCVMTLSGSGQNDMTLQRADLAGAVHVDHPKLKMDSSTMQIGFAPSNSGDSKSVQVDNVIADGAVKTTMLDEQGAKRNIDADHLKVDMAETPDGQYRPSEVTAEGNVFSHDDQSQLHASRLIATLAPTTQPGDTPHVQHIVAQQNVTFAANDTSGSCDILTADAAGEDYDVRLTGEPAAHVKNKDSTLSGSLITLSPKRQLLGVVGAGTLEGSQPGGADQPGTPFTMTWQRELDFDGTTNIAHASQNIVFNSTAADGTKNTATGDQLSLKLSDAPSTTQPTTNVASAPPPPATTAPADALTAGFGQMRSKQVDLMTLSSASGNANVDSISNTATGTLLRRMHLEAPAVQVADGGQRMIVPSAGRMLFQDNRGASTQPTSQPATAPAPTMQPFSGGLSGVTAFKWQRRLEYDQKASQAKLDGDVVIAHQGTAGPADTFRIQAEHVVTDLEKSAATSQPADPGSMNKVRRMSATQNVHVSTKQVQFDATQIDFDPSTGLMIAKGDAQNPVVLYDEKGVTSGMFQEIWYDARSGQILRSFGVQGTIHR